MHLKTLGTGEHNDGKRWAVLFHEEFLPEFKEFPEPVRSHVFGLIQMLVLFGPQLGRPQVDTLKGSKYPNMKELRFRVASGAWRVAFAFDLKRRAILLVGGNKTGTSQKMFYKNLIEIAERRFEDHQRAVAEE